MLSLNGLIIIFLFGIGVGITFEGISNLFKMRKLVKELGMSVEDLQDSYNFAIGLLYEDDLLKLQHYVFLNSQKEKVAYREEVGNE